MWVGESLSGTGENSTSGTLCKVLMSIIQKLPETGKSAAMSKKDI